MYFMTINKVKPGVDPEEIGKVIPQHIQWIREQIGRGIIVQAGKWGDTGGMAIFKADSIAEAEKISGEDPLVKSGCVTLETERFYPNVEIE
ncbi:hypothetical protein MNBD_NITROSPIRAE02-1327 [hydrothermal vent metagenome]|uniref:YCII-related domain-containing protein n=1 Tax=hydrothermal vent metagenome TaxID=652676 RepID=A0A3B1DGQ3_9ZZZZ